MLGFIYDSFGSTLRALKEDEMITVTWYGVFKRPDKSKFTITKKFRGSDYDEILKTILSYVTFQNDCNGNVLIENGLKEISHAISKNPDKSLG